MENSGEPRHEVVGGDDDAGVSLADTVSHSVFTCKANWV
jgi:hypothetical protein